MGNARKKYFMGRIQLILWPLWGFSIKENLVARLYAPQIDALSNCISVGDIMDEHYGQRIARLFSWGYFTGLMCRDPLVAQNSVRWAIVLICFSIDRVLGCVDWLWNCQLPTLRWGNAFSRLGPDIIQIYRVGFRYSDDLYILVCSMLGGWQADGQSSLPAPHLTLPYRQPLAIYRVIIHYLWRLCCANIGCRPTCSVYLIGKSSKDLFVDLY